MLQITGHITFVIYQKPGFAIVRFQVSDGQDVVAKGPFDDLQVNEVLALYGDWVEYTNKEDVVENQFHAVAAFRDKPKDLKALESFLAFGVSGCGPARAKLLVRKHGDQLFEILSKGRVDRLIEIRGIGQATAERIANSFREKSLGYEVAAFLCSIGVKPSWTDKVIRIFGSDAVRLVEKNPYILVRMPGFGYKKADRIALKMGWKADSLQRAEATLFYALSNAAEEGHSYVARLKLVQDAADLMMGKVKKREAEDEEEDLEKEDAPLPVLDEELLKGLLGTALDACYEKKSLIKDTAHPQLGPVELTYLPKLYNAEVRLARKLRILLGTRPVFRYTNDQFSWIIKESEQALGLDLTDEQHLAVIRAFTEPISILTGGPGTGKSATQRITVDVARRIGVTLSLCAPTGRAAKHLFNVTGEPALTIHRLFKYDPDEDAWNCNEASPLQTGLVVVDEFSMVDIELAYRVFDAVKPGTPVLIIGDKDQLPAVSPGRVLEDLVNSNQIPISRLTKIFRQAEKSLIIQNAHRILRGESPRFPAEKDEMQLANCFLMQPPRVPKVGKDGRQLNNKKGRPATMEDYEWIKSKLLTMCRVNIPRRLKIDPIRDIQVLTPMKERGLGVRELNRVLQEALNPKKEGEVEALLGHATFRIGDRVQQYRNNYRLGAECDHEGDRSACKVGHEGVYNGDIGFVKSIDLEEKLLYITFGDPKHPIKYPFEDAKQDLHLAYAMSIHKSQGGEFPAVIVVLVAANYIMLQRNLLYTGATRARDLLVFMGQQWTIDTAVKNAEIQKRNSFLKQRLLRELDAAKKVAA